MTRGEVLRATGPTSGSKIKIKMGAPRDGKITGAEVWLAYEAGGFRARRSAPARCVVWLAKRPQFPGRRIRRGRNQAQDRGLPRARRHQRRLCVGDRDRRAGRKCGMDPIDFRIANAAKEEPSDCRTCLTSGSASSKRSRQSRNSPHYKSELKGPNRGRGVAAGFWFNAGMQSSADGEHPDRRYRQRRHRLDRYRWITRRDGDDHRRSPRHRRLPMCVRSVGTPIPSAIPT